MLIEINDDFDLRKIVTSGQCFRAKETGKDSYLFITGDKAVTIKEAGNGAYSVSCDPAEWESVWAGYFDLQRSYAELRSRHIKKNTFVDAAISYAEGIRILHQDPWETLVSFIISQRKSIPAIATAVETLCTRFGHIIDSPQGPLYSFPTVREMSGVSEADLMACGLGYRSGYILDAVKKVGGQEVRLEELYDAPDRELLSSLEMIYGVGKKVARCVALFAYGRTACVPVDVWIGRAIHDECAGEDPFALYGGDAGIIQQYVFYYERHLSRAHRT